MTRQQVEEILHVDRRALFRLFEALLKGGFIEAIGVADRAPGRTGKPPVVYRALKPASALPTLDEAEIKRLSRLHREQVNEAPPGTPAHVSPKQKAEQRQEYASLVRRYRRDGGRIEQLPEPDEPFKPITEPIGSSRVPRSDS